MVAVIGVGGSPKSALSKETRLRLGLLFLLFLLALGLSLISGPAQMGLGDILKIFGSPKSADEALGFIFWEVRLPRTGALLTVGGGLSLSSLLLQSWFHNPLAEPYNLGLSGGATLGAVLAAILGLSGFALVSGSFLGVVISSLLIFPFVLRAEFGNSHRLILTGVMLSFLLGSVATLVLAIDQTGQLGRMFDWLLGAVGTSRDQFWTAGAACLFVFFFYWMQKSLDLDLLLLPSEVARQLGLKHLQIRIAIVITVSVMTAWCVAIAGLIGFVGLLSPHAARLLLDSRKHVALIPGSTLVGATLLLLSDSLSRFLFPDFEVPVGCFMAILGAPILTLLLWKGGASYEQK
ncbi:MAG: iron ABC transporter permease [Bdellovibrionales bacterium]|nr:iron ABC transporter permease [Bdellovibrionales bacterium]